MFFFCPLGNKKSWRRKMGLENTCHRKGKWVFQKKRRKGKLATTILISVQQVPFFNDITWNSYYLPFFPLSPLLNSINDYLLLLFLFVFFILQWRVNFSFLLLSSVNLAARLLGGRLFGWNIIEEQGDASKLAWTIPETSPSRNPSRLRMTRCPHYLKTRMERISSVLVPSPSLVQEMIP